MACFLVPAAEAVVTTAAGKILEKHENKAAEKKENTSEIRGERFSVKLKRLSNLLWGGTGLLAFEHLWHGEIQPFAPFLTAAGDSQAMAGVLHEMSTVGVGMAVVVTAAWGVFSLVLDAADKKAAREALQSETAKAEKAPAEE